jgi:hypothetical protein
MDERERLREWVQNWKELGPILDAIRQQEIREADNVAGLRQLGRAINYATRTAPPRQESGLVEMQICLAKLRR